MNFNSIPLRKCLAYFFSEEGQEITVLKASRLLGLDEQETRDAFSELESEGVVGVRMRRGDNYYYPCRGEIFYNHYYHLFKRAFNIESELRKYIGTLNHVEQCHVIGDCSGVNREMEVLLIGKHDRRKARRLVDMLQSRTGRRISLTNMSVRRFSRDKVAKELVLEEALQLV